MLYFQVFLSQQTLFEIIIWFMICFSDVKTIAFYLISVDNCRVCFIIWQIYHFECIVFTRLCGSAPLTYKRLILCLKKELAAFYSTMIYSLETVLINDVQLIKCYPMSLYSWRLESQSSFCTQVDFMITFPFWYTMSEFFQTNSYQRENEIFPGQVN